MARWRWLLADQLGPHFLDDDTHRVLLVETRALFARRRLHRQKAHLILSALRHRAAELGDRARLVRADTFREALTALGAPVEMVHPPSRAALAFARTVDGLDVLPPRGFVTDRADFAAWADRRRGRLRMTDFYRYALDRYDLRAHLPPPTRRPPRRTPVDVPPPPAIVEDDIDAQVRRDLDRWQAEGIRFVGRDGPRRYPATHAEARARLVHFLEHRLPGYAETDGRLGDRTGRNGDSLLSSSFNLGLLDPAPAIRAALHAGRNGAAPAAGVHRFVRGLFGWREFLWQLYWYFEPRFRGAGWLAANQPLPEWFDRLDADAVDARCLADALAGVRDTGWVDRTTRLTVLGNYGLQRGWRPAELADWFRRSFVDGTDWVMNATVIGMSQYADLARIDTHPWAFDGTHLDRIGDHCGGCRYVPKEALGDPACPYTAGFEAFLHRNRERLAADPRLAAELAERADPARRDAVLAQEERRGATAP
ncbi:cryptochrome/photolyase family protein [Micromonospora auratinigra]|uniref:Deoxyribodipyrimidine photolyase-related protein n=1 Tax=Micromonospora auratinigra TaxID=261654 RepID=A0A1A8Z5L8_9ACTN|nr:cryptochrome/photolyase family protein [Micromonospora auratinigra]SBT39141.1 deoxyribodipyrimidine photolyase-related protein [Micromonospora auratinigra]